MGNEYQKISAESAYRVCMLDSESLWHSETHLLWVKQSGLIVPIVEEYRRIRYEDIQGVVIHRLAYSKWITAIYFGLALLVLLGVSAAWIAVVFQGPWLLGGLAVPALIFLGLGIGRMVRGQPVSCRIRTAAQSLQLKSINRERQANHFLELLAHKISEKGERLTESELLQRVQVRRLLDPLPNEKAEVKAEYEGGYHRNGFGLMILQGCAHILPWFISSFWAVGIVTSIEFVALFYLIIAAAKQRKRYIPASLRRLTIGSLIYIIFIKYTLGFYLATFSWAFQEAREGRVLRNPLEVNEKLAEYFKHLTPQSSDLYAFFLIGDFGLTSLWGVAGILVARQWYTKVRR